MNGAVDVKIVFDLWNIVLSIFISIAMICGGTLTLAFLFVRRSECSSHVQESNHIQSELFEKISELSNDITAIKETLGFFRGQMEAAKK